ncbi:MAG: hypothetical protein IKW39_02450 [Alphaproteobacteria bacterium]|nr:hypothetical protein [Alphaproteobacteria bacterium]
MRNLVAFFIDRQGFMRKIFEVNFNNKLLKGAIAFSLLCQVCACSSTIDEEFEEVENNEVICTWSSNEWISRGGLKICPNKRRCSDEELVPYQPCVQPMPTYYNDVDLSEGDVELIHPYTRTVVLCYDEPGKPVQSCVDAFRREGYVLITDIPQLPARYDVIVEGTYPARRWGGKREQVVPRW